MKNCQNGLVKVEMRNRFAVGDTLEVLSPDQNFNKQFKVEKIINSNGEEILDAKGVQEVYTINCPFDIKELDILRSC